MKYGYFDDARREYVITTPKTPLPWSNILANEEHIPNATKTTKLAGRYIKHINGSIGEIQGYNAAIQDGEIGLQEPGVVTASGPDYITYNPDTGYINVWDAKYSSGGRWPTSAKGFGSEEWLSEVEEAINRLGNSDLKDEIKNAFENGKIDWKIFKWPQ